MDSGMLDIRLHDFQILRMDGAGGNNLRSSRNALGHQYRFSKCCRAVVHRRVRYFHPGELTNQSLEFKDGLQSPLGNLWLIWRVSSKELRPRDDVIDYGWNVM